MRSILLRTNRCKPRSHRHCLLGVSLILLTMALGLVACSDATEHPTGSSQVVLRIETGGGFVPVEYSLTQLPGFTLYGDGTIVVTGPMIEIYPQPALPNLQRTTVTQDDIVKFLSAAKEAGLFTNNVDYGTPNVTDLPTTTITTNTKGQTYVSNIYALGYEQSFEQSLPENAPVGGLTLEQSKAREAVLTFATKVGDPDAFLSTQLKWEQYPFTSLAVYSLPVDPSAISGDDGVQPNHLDWPLDDLSIAGEAVSPEGYRRVVVTGTDLTELEPLLDQATQITLWKSGDREYYLYFRPLLPDESA